MEVGARSDAHQYTSDEILRRQKTMWADQAADKRAISVVLMMLSPVVVDGSRSVPAVGEGVNGKNCLVACMRPSHARR